jgi:hypothetical protein
MPTKTIEKPGPVSAPGGPHFPPHAPAGWRVERAKEWEARKKPVEPHGRVTVPAQTPNTDDAAFADHRASFSKGLMHDPVTGLVQTSADYQHLRDALLETNSRTRDDLDTVPLAGERRLVNPRAAFAIELIGGDPRHYASRAAPTFGSDVTAAEMVELYWMALLRDVPFHRYATSPLVAQACADLQTVSAALYNGDPMAPPTVTPQTLFRGIAPGDFAGPYLSQFFMQRVPVGAQEVDQRMRTVAPGVNYMTNWVSWHAIQNGAQPSPAGHLPATVWMRDGRDLGEYVHVDALYQAYFNACLILLAYGGASDPNCPYLAAMPHAGTQHGFATFGGAHILALVTEVSTRALKAVWNQKWRVHRRLRPEVFAGRIERMRQLNDPTFFGIDQSVFDSNVLDRIAADTGSHLLPMAFPEGSPMHPAYGAGHATVAGACVTILKAFFDEAQLLSDCVDPFTGQPMNAYVADDNGERQAYTGADADMLTVGGELNKLAANIAIGRNHAGVHWRTDYTESLYLGQQIAIDTLCDYHRTYAEMFGGFQLTLFDGTAGVVDENGFN